MHAPEATGDERPREQSNSDVSPDDHSYTPPAVGNGHLSAGDEDLFDVLANERRRRIIALLADAPPGNLDDWDVSALVDQIAASETGQPADAVDATARKRVYVAIYQTHLDTLHRARIVDYDRQLGRVRQGSEWARAVGTLHAALRAALDETDPSQDTPGLLSRIFGRGA